MSNHWLPETDVLRGSQDQTALAAPAPRNRAPGRTFGIGAVAIALCLAGGCSPPSAPGAGRLRSRIYSHVEIIGIRGTGAGELNKPRSVAVDTVDNLYVVDMTGRVQKFSPDGRFLLLWQMPQTDLGKPKGMCRDGKGNIVVLEPHYQRVNHYSPDGDLIEQWGHQGTEPGRFSMPRAVAADSRGNLFVSEYSAAERVQGFSAQGKKLLVAFGQSGAGNGEFSRPEGLGIDAEDRIYVADSCNHRIQVFSPEGKWLRTFGRAGSGLGELSYPYDVKVDAEGRQYVCEFGNSRIQIFDARNVPLEILGRAGSGLGQFHNPWSIALDSRGNLYVADGGNHRVQKLVRRKESSRVAPGELHVFQTPALMLVWLPILLRLRTPPA